ncbi:MAG: helix-turn-helix transcriptional regulator [Ruminococcus sp.]|nr:helix-turn-helix transcriptional regulator [Ruminococcus sp.]
MANKNYFINGVTELLILSLLKERDMYVYEIVKAVENHSGGLLAISQNTLYTSTYKLIGEEMLSEYTKLVGKRRTRVYYHLEKKGEEYLAQLQENYRRNMQGVENIMTAIDDGTVRAEAPAREYIPDEEEIPSSAAFSALPEPC